MLKFESYGYAHPYVYLMPPLFAGDPVGGCLNNPDGLFIGTCPDCGSQLEYAEGCVKCHVCGFSECG